MNVIDMPFQAFIRQRQPQVEGDAENQLHPVPSPLSILPSQSEAPSSSKSTHTQDSVYLQHHSSSKNEFAERDSKDLKPHDLPKGCRKPMDTGNTAGASALGSTEEVESVRIEEIGPMQHQKRPSVSEHHLRRKEHLLKILDPLIGEGSSTLLLCRGEEDQSHIIPVHIRDSADSEDQWREAHRVWNEWNLSWRSWLPRYGVRNVSVVTLQLFGRDPESNNTANGLETWFGIYRPEPTKAEISRLKDRQSGTLNLECSFCASDETWNHDRDCPSLFSDEPGFTCPHDDDYRARRTLSRLQSRPFLFILFRHPQLAEGHESMDDQGFLISHRDLLHKLEEQHRPNITDLSFQGLLIEEGWLVSHPKLKLSLFASSILFLSVITSWLVYRDWAIAWQVGGCFLAFITLICGCLHSAL